MQALLMPGLEGTVEGAVSKWILRDPKPRDMHRRPEEQAWPPQDRCERCAQQSKPATARPFKDMKNKALLVQKLSPIFPTLLATDCSNSRSWDPCASSMRRRQLAAMSGGMSSFSASRVSISFRTSAVQLPSVETLATRVTSGGGICGLVSFLALAILWPYRNLQGPLFSARSRRCSWRYTIQYNIQRFKMNIGQVLHRKNA